MGVMSEQDATTASTDTADAAPKAGTSSTQGGGNGYPDVTKWESGLARSVANILDSKVKWNSLYKITRGKANTLI